MNPIRTLARVLDFASDPAALCYLMSSKRPSIASYQICRGIACHQSDFGTIIDVGANQGQFALAAAHCFPRARIYSFEPVPSVVATIKRNTQKESRIEICPVALGRGDGDITFFENAYSHASSALAVSEKQKKMRPETGNVKEIKVPLRSLDTWAFSAPLAGPVLLKLDVQGLERDVLTGGKRFLAQVDYLVFESSFTRLYVGEPLFDEMHNFVSESGFEIVGPVGILEGQRYETLQMDMLYRRRVTP
jgi:FkbM family methyltransferase